MKIYIDDYKNLVIIISLKTICVDLPLKLNESLKHDIESIVSCNESLAEYKKKRFPNYHMVVNMYLNIKKELCFY